MNKIIVSVIIVLLFSTAVFAVESQFASCKEDFEERRGIKQAYVAVSYVSSKVVDNFYDRCLDHQYLLHYSCANKIPTTASATRCALRCVNGACVGGFSQLLQGSTYMKNVPSGKVGFIATGAKQAVKKKTEILPASEVPRAAPAFVEHFACEETDDGYDLAMKGKTKITYDSGAIITNEDYCKNNKNLVEFSCRDKFPDKERTVVCPLKCEKGACVVKFK